MLKQIESSLLPLLWLIALVVFATLISDGLLNLMGDFFPYAKLISKLTLVLLIFSVFPLRKSLGLSWQGLGFSLDRQRFIAQLIKGFWLGLVSLLPVIVTLYLLDVQVWDDARQWTLLGLAKKLLVALLLAILIAVGEELVFRGLLFSFLKERLSVFWAMLLGSFYFAALHFLKTGTEVPLSEVNLTTGVSLICEAFSNWWNPQHLTSLLALIGVGLFLSGIRVRQNDALGICIGCHASWVCQIKFGKDLLNLNPESDFFFLVSSYDGIIGPFVFVWMIVATLIMFLPVLQAAFLQKKPE